MPDTEVESLLRAFGLPIVFHYDRDEQVWWVYVNEPGYEKITKVCGPDGEGRLTYLIEAAISNYMREIVPLAQKRSNLK